MLPCLASFSRLVPSKPNGRDTTATVSRPASLAARAITGAAPVPVPPPIPAVMKHMERPRSCSSMAAYEAIAALRPTSGRAPAPSPPVSAAPSLMRCGVSDDSRACASVLAATKWMWSGKSPRSIMLLTALPPAPPTPTTAIFGTPARLVLNFRASCRPTTGALCHLRTRAIVSSLKLGGWIEQVSTKGGTPRRNTRRV